MQTSTHITSGTELGEAYKDKICFYNANGLHNKILFVSNFIHNHNFDIVSINETRLRENETFRIRDYTVIKQHRQDDGGHAG